MINVTRKYFWMWSSDRTVMYVKLRKTTKAFGVEFTSYRTISVLYTREHVDVQKEAEDLIKRLEE